MWNFALVAWLPSYGWWWCEIMSRHVHVARESFSFNVNSSASYRRPATAQYSRPVQCLAGCSHMWATGSARPVAYGAVVAPWKWGSGMVPMATRRYGVWLRKAGWLFCCPWPLPDAFGGIGCCSKLRGDAVVPPGSDDDAEATGHCVGTVLTNMATYMLCLAAQHFDNRRRRLKKPARTNRRAAS